MTDNTKVVEATESDVPAILGLLGELVDAVRDQGGLDAKAAVESLPALLGDPDSHLLVAKDGDATVGFINFTVRTTLLHGGPSGLIDELVVGEGLRGRGVGRALVTAAAETCRRLGCAELEASTEKTNAAAREFYKQCGFEEDAVLLEMQL